MSLLVQKLQSPNNFYFKPPYSEDFAHFTTAAEKENVKTAKLIIISQSAELLLCGNETNCCHP